MIITTIFSAITCYRAMMAEVVGPRLPSLKYFKISWSSPHWQVRDRFGIRNFNSKQEALNYRFDPEGSAMAMILSLPIEMYAMYKK